MGLDRTRTRRGAAVALALALTIAAACGSDADDEPPATTATPTTAEPVPSVEVTATFDGTVSSSEAEQAAATMERRLTTYYDIEGESADGVAVVVDEAGTGLVITVPGTDGAQAAELVTELSFRGDLYFRPGLAQYPAAPGEPLTPPDATPDVEDLSSSSTTSTVDGSTTSTADSTTTTAAPTTTTTTAPPATVPTPEPPADADPDGTSVLEWRDVDSPAQLADPSTAPVLSIWEVGPGSLSGTAVEDSQLTTLGGDPAVKVVLTDDDQGLGAFNQLAQECFSRTDACPTGAYTVTFDGTIVVASIPRPNDSTFRPFTQDDVIIYSSQWTEDVARTLAVAFEAGALPVPIVVTS